MKRIISMEFKDKKAARAIEHWRKCFEGLNKFEWMNRKEKCKKEIKEEKNVKEYFERNKIHFDEEDI